MSAAVNSSKVIMQLQRSPVNYYSHPIIPLNLLSEVTGKGCSDEWMFQIWPPRSLLHNELLRFVTWPAATVLPNGQVTCVEWAQKLTVIYPVKQRNCKTDSKRGMIYLSHYMFWIANCTVMSIAVCKIKEAWKCMHDIIVLACSSC